MKGKLKIIDLTQRLPGPMAGKILAGLGHEVIKIEDQTLGDPFSAASFDPSFAVWYKTLNQEKKILKLNFKSSGIKEEIRHLISHADIVLFALPEKLKIHLGLDDESLKNYQHPLSVVELQASSQHSKAMHDLNAMALSGHLSLHIQNASADQVDPPFMPFAGIAFGQQVATKALSQYIEALSVKGVVNSTSYLLESTQEIFDPLWPKELVQQKLTKFLHNGAYPCYSLYRLNDGNYVALAAVEEKFWSELIKIFQINLPLENRFNTDPTSFKHVSQAFAKYTTSEIEDLTKDKELCLSIVRKVS